MLRRALVITSFATVSAVMSVQAQSARPSVQGTWTLAEVVTTGANAATNSNPQPGLYIFTNRHYSLVSVTSTQPRPNVPPAKTPGKLTDAEKVARYDMWSPLTAQSGTYEIKGTTLTTRPLVAKNVGVMTGPASVAEFKLEGNTLWLTTKSAAGQPVSETRRKLTRVE